MVQVLTTHGSGKLVMEMIDFQTNDKFGKEMEIHIAEIVEAVKEGMGAKAIAKLEATKSLENTIFKRLKLSCGITTHQHLAAIIPLYANQHHVLLNRQWHDKVDLKDQVKFLESMGGRRGYVDTKKATLGGFFSEYKHSIYMNFKELVTTFKMEAPEITAILLHELGHGFYACEYSDRTDTVNQVLVNVSKEMSKEKTKRNPEYIYKELLKVNPNTKKEMVQDVVAGSRIIPSAELFKYTMDTVGHQLENHKYDETAFENLADNFAARFGYGPMLVSALKKINEVFPENSLRRFAFFVMLGSAMFCILAAIFLVFVGPWAIGYSIFYAYIGTLLTWALVANSGEEGRDYTYDDLKIRYKRIRDQLVQQIKAGDYEVKDAMILIKDIEQMDDLIKTTGQYRSGLDFIMNYIRPANFRAKKSIERQQLLEDLVSNELFIQSLKLQSLATA